MISAKHSKSKESLRKELLLERRSLDRDEWLRKSGEIVGRVKAMQVILDARRIHCYVSMEREREVCTLELLEWLCLERKELYLPYIERGQMVAARYTISHKLLVSAIGPPVPDPLVFSDECGFDAVIVPLAGFDRRGGRIGYGKGWYDRFFDRLATRAVRPVRIGLAFDFQAVASIPSDSWDEPLDMVVTESEIINCLTMRA
ncbi:MAG: 5-formyltetrahydrofolate cyclo-ligase [Chlorobiaceae bacterium]|nr:5-formyltetrahydrofolate cyclo-ligase [Chlorobiaceae bacterium]